MSKREPSDGPEDEGVDVVKGEFGGMITEDGQVIDEDKLGESLDLNMDDGEQKIWLVRLPKYLAERWKNNDQIYGNDLGKVRIKQSNEDALNVKLILNEIPDHENIPHEYKINLNKKKVTNEYAFSERNFKEFKSEVTEMTSMPEQPELKSLDTEEPRWQSNDDDQEGPKMIPFVKTIPKDTSLIGTICHECHAIPSITDKRYKNVLNQRKEADKPRGEVTFLDEVPGVMHATTGPSVYRANTSKFMRKKEKDKSEGRAIRMPQKDLLDLLFRLFDEYDYWSLKGLRERTKQPENYLKECVESIALLVKKGPYALKYSLKPEYKKLREAERQRQQEQSKDQESDEDEVEMEDVV